MYKNKTVSLIIPCHNEAPRIANVIRPALRSKYLDELVVVDDSSADASVARVLEFDGKIKLIRNKRNLGKARSVLIGAKSLNSDFVFILDGDLVGLKPNHIDQSIKELVEKDLDMLIIPVSISESILHSIGDMLGGDVITAGQRIINRRKLVDQVRGNISGYGFEPKLNRVAQKHVWKTDIIIWRSKTKPPISPNKVKKFGLITGLKQEFKMLSDVFKESSPFELLMDYNTYIINKSRAKKG